MLRRLLAGRPLVTSALTGFGVMALGDAGVQVAADELDVSRVLVTSTWNGAVSPGFYVWYKFIDTVYAGCSAGTEEYCDNDAMTVAEGPAPATPCEAWNGGSAHKVEIATTDNGGMDIAYNAAATVVEAELEKLPGVGAVNVLRSLVDEEGGYLWTASFVENDGNVGAMQCKKKDFVATNAACDASTVVDGNVLAGSFMHFLCVYNYIVPFPYDGVRLPWQGALDDGAS